MSHDASTHISLAKGSHVAKTSVSGAGIYSPFVGKGILINMAKPDVNWLKMYNLPIGKTGDYFE